MFSPKKSICSRYSLKKVDNKYYDTIDVTDTPIVGKKSNSPMEQGYVFAPYVMARTGEFILNTNNELFEDLKRKIKQIKRNDKIDSILNDQ